MTKYLFFIFCWMCFFIQANGGNLVGRVVNKQGSPEYMSCVINLTRQSADFTDENGMFDVEAEYGDSLVISNEKPMVMVYEKGIDTIILDDLNEEYELPYITDEVIRMVNKLYLMKRYKDCLAYCMYYCDGMEVALSSESRPYKNWKKNHEDWALFYDIEDIAKLCYWGSVSAYKYSLIETNSDVITNGVFMARACANIFYDIMQSRIPSESWNADMMSEYLGYGFAAVEAIKSGAHLLKVFSDSSFGKKNEKWFERKLYEMLETMYQNTNNKELLYPEYPILQFYLSTIHSFKIVKNDIKKFTTSFNERMQAFTQIVHLYDKGYIDNCTLDIHNALGSLTTALQYAVVESDVCKKIGNNFERFCMENLIKLQDISYFLNGALQYSEFSDYTLLDIQNSLKDNECAILHFEAPVASGYLYYQYDLSTRYRNYALIITKNQEIPDVWHRGYINDTIVNDLSKIKKIYPNANRFFYVGTPRMTVSVDVAGKDSSVVRLHSLSQLMHRKHESVPKDVTFVGDINYDLVGDKSYSYENNSDGFEQLKGKEECEKYEPLPGTRDELKQIKLLFNNAVHPICGDEATKDTVINMIRRAIGVVHISTHGYLKFAWNKDIEPSDLALNKHVMDYSYLLLSGCNERPRPSSSYITGGDILKIGKIGVQVVFIDACSSGSGFIGTAGPVSIVEAFHTIGAKNIICYLEPVEDDIATEFSNRFYLELSKGKSCHSAFFAAKNSMDKDIKVVLWE